MLKTLFPLSFRRYSSLKIFGPIMDEFIIWLQEHRYSKAYTRERIWLLPYIESFLIRRGVHHLNEIEQADLAACRKSLARRFPHVTKVDGALETYLRRRGLLQEPQPTTTSAASKYLAAYAQYLENVRGAAASTIRQNSYTASEFLAHLRIEKRLDHLKALTPSDLEAFTKNISHRFSRASLRQIVGRLRCFLRFLAVQGEIPQGLDRQIDAPRVYQQEQLPRALPWETVQAFLDSIDRSRLVGLRDFTMFLLMAIYGLRACDVAALTLDNIQWRARKICISQRKTGSVLELPLTDTAGTALYEYLKRLAPPAPFRQIFLSVKAPIGTLTTSALSTRFRFWARRSRLEIPGRGSCHRIRHSYAVFLLRQGTAVKTIGDILGHRTLQSTWTYFRLSIEDLRDVALPVPVESETRKAVRS
jgi:site-specific recombinase XerD